MFRHLNHQTADIHCILNSLSEFSNIVRRIRSFTNITVVTHYITIFFEYNLTLIEIIQRVIECVF